MKKCLVCGKEAIEVRHSILRDIDRPLCEKHTQQLEGYVLCCNEDYARGIRLLRSYFNKLIKYAREVENQSQKQPKQGDSEEEEIERY